jgi:Skp family chaperone for outer membrane proteins
MFHGHSAALVVRSTRRAWTVALLIAAGFAVMPASLAVAQAAPAASQGNSRIAVVNTRRVLGEIQEVKSLQAKADDDNKRLNEQSKGKLEALRKMQSDRDTNFKPGTPQYEEMSKAIITEKAKYKVWLETEKANVEFTMRKDMRGVFDKIQSAAGRLAKRDGYEMVIAENIGDKIPDEQLEQLDPLKLQALLLERRVLYVAERNDLTQHVILMLDADFKNTARAPAANAGGK